MQLSPEDIIELELLSKKNPLIASLFDDWKKLTQSDYLDGFLTVDHQINTFNKEIRESKEIKIVQVQVVNEEGKLVGTMDKTFDNTHKYVSSIDVYYEKREWLRGKLSPQELEQIQDKNTAKKKGTQIIA